MPARTTKMASLPRNSGNDRTAHLLGPQRAEEGQQCNENALEKIFVKIAEPIRAAAGDDRQSHQARKVDEAQHGNSYYDAVETLRPGSGVGKDEDRVNEQHEDAGALVIDFQRRMVELDE